VREVALMVAMAPKRQKKVSARAKIKALKQSKTDYYRDLRAQEHLCDEARHILAAEGIAAKKTLEVVARVPEAEQVTLASRIVASGAKTTGDVQALLGKRSPRYALGRRQGAILPSLRLARERERPAEEPPAKETPEQRRVRELFPRCMKRGRISIDKIEAAIRCIVENPLLTPKQLIGEGRRQFSRSVILRAWLWLIAMELDGWLSVHESPEDLAWLKAELSRRFPELDPDRLAEEELLLRVVTLAGSRDVLRDFLDKVEANRGDAYTYNDPIFGLGRRIFGLPDPKTKKHIELWHYWTKGQRPPLVYLDESIIPYRTFLYGGRKIPKRSTELTRPILKAS
jgi:hypothetical protein